MISIFAHLALTRYSWAAFTYGFYLIVNLYLHTTRDLLHRFHRAVFKAIAGCLLRLAKIGRFTLSLTQGRLGSLFMSSPSLLAGTCSATTVRRMRIASRGNFALSGQIIERALSAVSSRGLLYFSLFAPTNLGRAYMYTVKTYKWSTHVYL